MSLNLRLLINPVHVNAHGVVSIHLIAGNYKPSSERHGCALNGTVRGEPAAPRHTEEQAEPGPVPRALESGHANCNLHFHFTKACPEHYARAKGRTEHTCN